MWKMDTRDEYENKYCNVLVIYEFLYFCELELAQEVTLLSLS